MLKTLETAARSGGAVILAADRIGVTEKGGDRRNLVTQYDVRVQELLRTQLLAAYPEAHFIGEEGDAQKEDALHGLAFIVDPIDGTAKLCTRVPRVCGFDCSGTRWRDRMRRGI